MIFLTIFRTSTFYAEKTITIIEERERVSFLVQFTFLLYFSKGGEHMDNKAIKIVEEEVL